MEKDIVHLFEAVEQKVRRITKVCRTLEADNKKLKNEIAELESRVLNGEEVEKQFAAEKNLIRSRIDNLLERLDEFDYNLEGSSTAELLE